LHKLSRLIVNPWIRAGLLFIVLGFCGYGLYLVWPQVQPALRHLQWYSVAASAAAAAAGAGCMMLAWRALLADLGSPLPVKACVRINGLAQLGKYVPGAVWSFAAMVELGHDYQVPRRRGFASVAIGLAVGIGTGLVVAAVALPLASASVARHYLLALAVIPVILACLYPPVLGRLLNRALVLLRQQPLEAPPTMRGLGLAVAWSLAGWLLYGLQVWLVAADMTGHGAHIVLLVLGGYALATSAGLLLVVFPAGIGAREVIMIAVFTLAMSRSAAVAIALVTRVLTTASDLGWGGIALLVRRAAARPVRGRHARSGKDEGCGQTADYQQADDLRDGVLRSGNA
jgi:hypothetical protein